MKRPVHYAAATTGGMAFNCYFEELKKHSESGTPKYPNWQERGWTSAENSPQKYAYPSPLKHTDLRRVTCLNCWKEILALAKSKVES